MIDFRYHVVSLISVFLALAVGIALGAGPLKETIGDTLTGQVQQLRTEKDTLRSQLDDANSDLSDTQSYVEAASPQLLAGSLTDRRVVVIELGDLKGAERKGLAEHFKQAGASITGYATLTDAWSDPDQRSFRQALVGNLTQFLAPAPAQGADLETELAAALVQGLTGADKAAPDKLSQDASYLLEILTTGDSPLVTLADPVTVAADAVVVVSADEAGSETVASPTAPPSAEDLAPELSVISAAQEYSTGAVLADGARAEGSLTDTILADDDLSAALTTVSDAQEVAGQLNVPLALAARIAGTNGHYGFGDDETTIPPAVQLPPVDRTPVAAQPSGGATSKGSAG
ncbi:copper transporter [Cellulomonas sp. JH27-2]|uniref:copper transporter n=1 Tax=Cellulomonas sp. JH27-2 TaxID=2774139 RepID=UPI001781DABE|nr:copper transporter [Cellulomonas sp. JH27-2]